jgi:hypothetical protein
MIQENSQITLNGVQIGQTYLINGLGILQELKEMESFLQDEKEEVFHYQDYKGHSQQDQFKFFVKENEQYRELTISCVVKVKSMIQLLHSFSTNFVSKIVK